MSIRLLMRPLLALSLGALLVLGGCVAQPETKLSYSKLDFAALPGWGTDDLQGLGVAWRASCKAKPDPRWQSFCAGLPAADGALRAYIEQNLTPWQLVTPSGDTGLFTGYYAPEFKASLTRQGVYQTPIYAMPSDLAIADLGVFKPELRGQQITGRVERGRFVPYPDRAEIMQQALAAAPVLAWAADPLDVFFLQIQGSGRAELTDGTALDLGYAGQNGRPYVAVGKLLKEEGAFPDGVVTMPAIRAWLTAHPAEQTRILNGNPSYVFFRRLPGPAQGAAGLVLTPLRSLAVDTHFTALGSPLWLVCDHPAGGTLQRLLLAQDSGGAIRGPIRGDVYWGYGAEAAARAGVMQSRGQLYLLLPSGVTPPEVTP